MDGTEPVSYTHLDVYKRQKHDLSKGGRSLALETLGEHSPMPERMLCGIAEFDRALGGGFVAGSATLIGGDPGIGKSTLLLQAAGRLAKAGKSVVYILSLIHI